MKFADLLGFKNASVTMSYDEFEDALLKVFSAESANLASPQ